MNMDVTTDKPAEAENVIHLANVSKSIGGKEILHELDFSVRKGEFVSLIGPSGSGKTTTLRIAAGLEVPTTGSVMAGNRDITLVPPHRRGFAMVFQGFALFPHKDVFSNVAYGLWVRKTPRDEVHRRVISMLDRMELQDYAASKVSELSGGQRQRVAIARALIVEPSLILLDEPTGSLDAKLRLQMQMVLKSLHKELGLTFIHVTHNQSEALALADRVYVMHRGYIEQVGTPVEIFNQPRTRFVADFVGSNNLIDGVIKEGEFTSALGRMPVNRNDFAEGRCTAVFRSDSLVPGDSGEREDRMRITARLDALEYHGSSVRWYLSVGDTTLLADVGADATSKLQPNIGAEFRFSCDLQNFHFVRAPS